ncbi:hypothetical protein [Paenibacillus sp. FSL R5-0908]|uniref:hypothetical protein n=1 Tax=Paenibacillus sp. FSL R5-0908 TaxID=2921664 RepID=UPI0030FCB56F
MKTGYTIACEINELQDKVTDLSRTVEDLPAGSFSRQALESVLQATQKELQQAKDAVYEEQ